MTAGSPIERLCAERRMTMTQQRRVIARVIGLAEDHPSIEEIFVRARAIDGKIARATIYRTIRQFEAAGFLAPVLLAGKPVRFTLVPDPDPASQQRPCRRRPPPAQSYSAPDDIERSLRDRGMKSTRQRRIITEVVWTAKDYPSVEEIFRRSRAIDAKISRGTIYRTVHELEAAGVLNQVPMAGGIARYERADYQQHRLIDVKTGLMRRFHSEDAEALCRDVAARLGYDFVECRLILYGVPIKQT